MVMPYIRREFVPRTAFERIESELKRINERRQMLEEEVAQLRRELASGRHRVEVVQREVELEAETVTVVAPGGSEEKISIKAGRKARVRCPYCRETTVATLPHEDELEELAEKRYKVRFRCVSCGRPIDVDSEMILRKVRGE